MPRRTYIAATTDIVGITDRASNREAPYIKHPMIRQTWQTADKFRGMQGYYLAVSNEPLIDPITETIVPGSTFQNYSEAEPMLGVYEEPAWHPPETRRVGYTSLSTAGQNRARTFKIRDKDNEQWNASTPTTWVQNNKREEGEFLLLYDSFSWNAVGGTHVTVQEQFQEYLAEGSVSPVPLRSLLDQQILQGLDGQPYSQGYPYAYRYLVSGFNDADPIIQTSVNGIFQEIINTPFYDYTLEWQGRTETPFDGEITAYDWEITPIYNFYMGTSPPYETVTADINETLLPNYYILERIRQAPGLLGLANIKYARQVMLLSNLEDATNPERVLNASTIENGFTLLEGVPRPDITTTAADESQMLGIGYMQAYCGELQRRKTELSLGAVTTAFTSLQKNIAVVARDLPLINREVTRDNRGTVLDSTDDLLAMDTYPFYNRISIPYDSGDVRMVGGAPDPTGVSSVFQSMYNLAEADRMALNVIQMYVAHKLANQDAGTTKSFEVSIEDSPLEKRVVSINMDFLLDMARIWQPGQEEDNYIPIAWEMVQGAINAYTLPALEAEGDTQTNLIFLRDWGNNPLYTSQELASFLIGAPAPRLKQGLYNLGRSMYEILTNASCFNETLMYVIEKYVVDTEEGMSADPVQTFYISKDFVNQATVHYIDTQIRYGVQYHYVVKEVRLVVGSKYMYESVDIWHTENDGKPNYGRAVGNALGAYEDSGNSNSALSTFYESDGAYLNVTQNTPKVQYFAGKYVYQPTNQFNLDQSEVYGLAEWLTTSDHSYSDYGEVLMGALAGFADGIHFQFKTGAGAGGNAMGGLISDVMTGNFVPPYEVPAGNLTQAYATWLIERLYAGSGIGYELGTGDWAAAVHVLLHCPGCQRPPTFAEVKTDAGFQTAMTIGNTPSIRGAPVFALPGDDVMNIAWETYGALADYRILIGQPNWVPSPTKFLQFLKANPLANQRAPGPGNEGK